eukprot:5996762-Pleurochrysis_carterae.AAC.1
MGPTCGARGDQGDDLGRSRRSRRSSLGRSMRSREGGGWRGEQGGEGRECPETETGRRSESVEGGSVSLCLSNLPSLCLSVSVSTSASADASLCVWRRERGRADQAHDGGS